MHDEKLPSSLSAANQLIHVQRRRIADLESTVMLLERQIAEETKMRYEAWSKLAKKSSLNCSAK